MQWDEMLIQWNIKIKRTRKMRKKSYETNRNNSIVSIKIHKKKKEEERFAVHKLNNLTKKKTDEKH